MKCDGVARKKQILMLPRNNKVILKIGKLKIHLKIDVVLSNILFNVFSCVESLNILKFVSLRHA